MWKNAYSVLLPLLLAAAMWLWVQKVAIPHQQAEAAERGIPRGNLSDLYPRWLGARELLLRGRDPYAADVTREIQAGYYGRPLDPARPNDPRDQQAFAYPVYVVFVLAPAVWLPFSIVQKMFLCLLIGLTAASVLLWFQAVGWQASVSTKFMWIALTLGSFPAIQGFKLQQLTLLVAALLAASMFAISRRHFVIAGILLAVAGIKPQLIFLAVVWLGIWVIGDWRKRQRLFWSFALSMGALIFGGEVLRPGWLHEFRAASAAYYQYTGGGKSVLDVLLTPLWGRVLAAILVGMLLVLLWQNRHAPEGTADFQWSLALVMTTTLAVIPMFAPYNQLLLLPALMLIVRQARRLWTAHRMSRFLLGLAAVSMIWPWLAAGSLVIALFFLPGSQVQKAWILPMLTSFAIPVTVLALTLAGGSARRADGADT